jgi:hypothetical protein
MHREKSLACRVSRREIATAKHEIELSGPESQTYPIGRRPDEGSSLWLAVARVGRIDRSSQRVVPMCPGVIRDRATSRAVLRTPTRSPVCSCDSVGLANPHRPCDPGTRGHPRLTPSPGPERGEQRRDPSSAQRAGRDMTRLLAFGHCGPCRRQPARFGRSRNVPWIRQWRGRPAAGQLSGCQVA